MKFCTSCGSSLQKKKPQGDDRERQVCSACEIVHYQNPIMVAGAIPVRRGQILLCRRAIEPQKGLWTLPAGYLETGETVLQCAVRESSEEAGARLEELQPYALCNLTFVNQVYFFYRATLVNADFYAGMESLEVKLFSLDEIPWRELAFSVVMRVLREFCKDQRMNNFLFKVLDIENSMLSALNNKGSFV